MSATMDITLVKSVIGASDKQRAVIRGLGLRKLQQTVTLQDSPEVRGMVQKVTHMVKVS
ncbi:MAG: 50S ribosomal protein L30 [Trichlorobacter sp.]|nr:50S ribosomal protein L30 [Trichlorobacter sp.]